MFELVQRLSRFMTTMDAKTATSLGVSALLLALVIVMMAFGQQWFDLDSDGRLAGLFRTAAESRFAILIVISIFAFLALTGFPQILLITAAVVWFGPMLGAFYSWIATMVSATLTFGIGAMMGGDWVRKIGGTKSEALIGLLQKHGVLASGLIRVVPSAPFIVVNAAAGAARIPLWKYWAGSSVGIIPKISLVAALGSVAPDKSILSEGGTGLANFFTTLGPRHFLLIALIIGGWMAFLYLVRLAYVKLKASNN